MEEKLVKVCLIDADSLIYKVVYKNIEENNLKVHLDILDQWITDIITNCDCTHYLGFLTFGKVFRHNIATNREYKAGRPADKPKFFWELFRHMRDVWGFTYQIGLEAEDLVAIASHTYPNCIISGIDHDLYQLPGKHYNYVKIEHSEIQPWKASYELWTSMITGCTTDCIQGIPGMGKAKAHNLLTNKDLVYNDEILRSKVLECYIKHFGLNKGVTLFAETFRLLFLLRTVENVKDVLGVDYILPEPIVFVKKVKVEGNKSEELNPF